MNSDSWVYYSRVLGNERNGINSWKFILNILSTSTSFLLVSILCVIDCLGLMHMLVSTDTTRIPCGS